MEDVRKEFLQKLEQRQAEIEQTLEQLKETQREYNEQKLGNHINDESDQAQHEISVSNIYGLIERKSRELNNIRRLIKRISTEGSFGVCEECGEPIPAARLMIMPEATLCVPCQRELERFARFQHLPAKPSLERTPSREPEQEENGALYDLEFEWLEDESDESLPPGGRPRGTSTKL